MDEQQLSLYLNKKLKAVYFFLLKMGAIKEDAEDIVQETAFQFVQYLDTLQEEYVDAWLYRVAINKYYDSLRKLKYKNNYVNTFNLEELLDWTTPEQIIIENELHIMLSECLRKIPQKYAEILLLKYSGDLSLKDIAIIYGTTDKSIKTQLARAKKIMRKMIEEVK
ncbi:sigma-70 family RNA polymerase sigma factor [Peribacillus sp. FSL E2-0159]|uniref:RNA polymerase sigma factor n=1 Tax=Peribacillus sp. FSL E2-0159 TaxID=2975289 RepID=UPI00315A157F